ncbi:hypothetical protein QZH41_010988 [Actinostola sp. cb2023]|nr:hypothetical protein QZH41_010988 [Actinostola sp. cb2023]
MQWFVYVFGARAFGFLVLQNNMSSSEAVMTSSTASGSTESRLAASLQPQPEKPFHYTYLKEFRVEQCPLFLQHKCTAHRPFTCFHWHFMNQRRRRPKKKRDGTFNYSPDVYCTQYDETTGICPSGDDCPYLHRVAGDVERRYHLRYYKTATCVYETDSRGYCVKNGPHCAFAHGPHDLRQPVYDVRELQAMEKEDVDGQQGAENKAVIEDPRWQDTNFVLSNYKTEQCKKPPRLCRQGYACPYYHNTRDRRRSPRKYRYRSTSLPNVMTCSKLVTAPEVHSVPLLMLIVSNGFTNKNSYSRAYDESTLSREVADDEFNVSLGLSSGFGLDGSIPSSLPQPVGKPSRSLSTSSVGSIGEPLTPGGSYPKAPGSERSERSSSREEEHQAAIRRQILSIENDPNLDEVEKARRKQQSNPYRASPLIRSGLPSSIFEPLSTQLHSPKQLGSPQLPSPLDISACASGEVHRLNEELISARTKLASWEDCWVQAKQACDAWKKEAEQSITKAKNSHHDKLEALLKLTEAEKEISTLKNKIECLRSDPEIHVLTKISELGDMSIPKLTELHNRLSSDLQELNKVMYVKQSLLCSECHENRRSIVTLPCSHCLMCEACASHVLECPKCLTQITQQITAIIP